MYNFFFYVGILTQRVTEQHKEISVCKLVTILISLYFTFIVHSFIDTFYILLILLYIIKGNIYSFIINVIKI